MSILADQLDALPEELRSAVRHVHDVVRSTVPEATEGVSYGMPAFLYAGKGIAAVAATRKGLSFYPFCNTTLLGVDLTAYDGTTGSIHFTVEAPIADEDLRAIVRARVKMIEQA